MATVGPLCAMTKKKEKSGRDANTKNMTVTLETNFNHLLVEHS